MDTYPCVSVAHTCAHAHGPQPSLRPNDAQSPAAEKGKCLQKSRVPGLQVKGKERAGGAEAECHCL